MTNFKVEAQKNNPYLPINEQKDQCVSLKESLIPLKFFSTGILKRGPKDIFPNRTGMLYIHCGRGWDIRGKLQPEFLKIAAPVGCLMVFWYTDSSPNLF